MNAEDLTDAMMALERLEQRARKAYGATDLVERESALRILRLTLPLKRSVEGWIARRACRAAAAVSALKEPAYGGR